MAFPPQGNEGEAVAFPPPWNEGEVVAFPPADEAALTSAQPPAVSLGARIDQWLAAAQQPALENTSAFDHEENAGQFAELLKLRQVGVNQYDRNEPGEVLQAGAEVIKAIAADPELRKQVFAMAESALGSCADNVSTGFSAIVNAVRNHHMATEVKEGRMDASGLMSWAGQQFRLDALESEVHRFIRTSLETSTTALEANERALDNLTGVDRQARILDRAAIQNACLEVRQLQVEGRVSADPDAQWKLQLASLMDTHDMLKKRVDALTREPVETMMHAKVMLREKLDLPPGMPSSMLFHNYSALTVADIGMLESAVRAREADVQAVGDFMLANETWRVGIKQLHAGEYAGLMKPFDDDPFYDEEIPPNDDAHVAESAAYAERAAALGKRMADTENAWLKKFVVQSHQDSTATEERAPKRLRRGE